MSTPRRVPPPCWTQDETLALVEAYRDRWFALRRGNLRASDWEAVAAVVAASPASSSAPKTSLQCRHKIEKLRKRYRTEKQRCLACPGRFFSSWDLFPLLDSMGIGFPSTSAVGFNLHDHDSGDEGVNGGDGFFLKAVNDKTLNMGFDFGGGFGVKVVGDSRSKNFVKIDGDFKANTDLYNNLGSGFGVKMKKDMNFVPQGVRVKSYREIDDSFSPNADFDHYVGGGVDVVGGGFPVKSLGDRSLVPPGFKPKNYGKVDGNFKSKFDCGIDKGSGISSKISSERDSVMLGFRSKNYARMDGNLKTNVDFRVLNRNSSSLRLGLGKKIGGSGGVKRGRDPVEEMVSSIHVFAERFVKMEMKKMEMARDIEKMRMKMELKCNEMILESQQRIVDAFAKALSEKKKKKMKVVSTNANGNRDEADRDDA